MSGDRINVISLLSGCIHIAKKANNEARLLVLSSALQISVKTGPLDLLTNVDLEIQSFLVGNLLACWPRLNIVGEEQIPPKKVDAHCLDLTLLDKVISPSFNVEYPLEDVVVYIDPIDGTKEFTEGIYSQVTILIGIAVKGSPIAGVISQPWKENSKESPEGFLIWGHVGHGVGYFPEKPDFGSGIKQLPNVTLGDFDENSGPNELVVAVTKSRSTVTLEEGLKKLKPSQILRVGGCGYKISLIILEKAHIFYQPAPETSKWDTCGPSAILLSMGGEIRSMDGSALVYGGGPLKNPAFVASINKKYGNYSINKLTF